MAPGAIDDGTGVHGDSGSGAAAVDCTARATVTAVDPVLVRESCWVAEAAVPAFTAPKETVAGAIVTLVLSAASAAGDRRRSAKY